VESKGDYVQVLVDINIRLKGPDTGMECMTSVRRGTSFQWWREQQDEAIENEIIKLLAKVDASEYEDLKFDPKLLDHSWRQDSNARCREILPGFRFTKDDTEIVVDYTPRVKNSTA
jgi:hypothetical protein